MYIVTDKNDVVFYMSESLDYQSNGNLLVDNGALAIAKYLVKDVFEVEDVPNGGEVQKYCYTEDKGFYKNENYKELEASDTEKIKQLQEQVTDLQLALAEMYESEV